MLTGGREDGGVPAERHLVHGDPGHRFVAPQGESDRDRGPEHHGEAHGHPFGPPLHLDIEQGPMGPEPPNRERPPAGPQGRRQIETATAAVHRRSEEDPEGPAQEFGRIDEDIVPDPAPPPGIVEETFQIVEREQIGPGRVYPQVSPEPPDRPGYGLVESDVGGLEPRVVAAQANSAP